MFLRPSRTLLMCSRTASFSSSNIVKSFVDNRPVFHVDCTWTGNGLNFSGVDSDNKNTTVAVQIGAGKDTSGVSPMKLLLMSLATCALADVVIILQKSRVESVALRCLVAGQRSETQPRPFENIQLQFEVEVSKKKNDETSAVFGDEQFARAVSLSIEKYCGVHATLAGGPANISYTSKVKEVD